MTLTKEMREATAKDLAFLDNIIKHEQESPLRSVMHCEYEAMQRISALVRTLLDATDEGWKRFGDERPESKGRVDILIRGANIDRCNSLIQLKSGECLWLGEDEFVWRPASPAPEPAEGKRE